MSADFEYDVLNLDSSSVATLKSLTHCEFVSGQDKVCSVRCNLAKCYQEWVNIGAAGFILNVIRDGYKIPFIVFPPPKISPNNGSALKERKFVSEAIFNHIRNKCLEFLDHPPAIVNPISVQFHSVFRQEETIFRFETCQLVHFQTHVQV